MPIHDQYRRQVRLLMRLLPIVAAEPCFAKSVDPRACGERARRQGAVLDQPG